MHSLTPDDRAAYQEYDCDCELKFPFVWLNRYISAADIEILDRTAATSNDVEMTEYIDPTTGALIVLMMEDPTDDKKKEKVTYKYSK